jgi:hypothetical protein
MISLGIEEVISLEIEEVDVAPDCDITPEP